MGRYRGKPRPASADSFPARTREVLRGNGERNALLEGRRIGRHGLPLRLASGRMLAAAALLALPAASRRKAAHKAVASPLQGSAERPRCSIRACFRLSCARPSHGRWCSRSHPFRAARTWRCAKLKLRRGRRTVSVPLTRRGPGRDQWLRGAATLTVTASSGKGRKRKVLGRSSTPLSQSVAAVRRSGSARTGARRSRALASTASSRSRATTTRSPDSGTPTGLRVNIAKDSTPTNLGGTHIDPAGINRSDGFSPGESIVTRDSGPGQPDGLPEDGSGSPHGHGSSLCAEPADRPDRCLHGAAPADLVRARRERVQPGQHRPDHPPRAQPAGGPSLHRRDARPEGLGREHDPSPSGIRALSRRRQDRRAGHREPPRPLRRDPRQAPAERESRRANLYDAWDFTVASTPNITQRMLSIRDRGLADLGDTTPGDGTMDGDRRRRSRSPT